MSGSYVHDVIRDFDALNGLMMEMIQAQCGLLIEPGEEWINDAQILAIKLFKQTCSTRVMLSETELVTHDGQCFPFIDHSSATILARACIESYIVLHWIFQNEDRQLRQFRHSVWKLAGLIDRLSLHPSSDIGRAKVAETEIQVAELKAVIEQSSYLQQYTPKQAKRILKGEWRVDWSWADEAVRAGFNKKYFDNLYGHFCGYAHSSYISTMQIGQASDLGQQYRMAEASLQVVVHVMSRFVHFYADLFPSARETLEDAPQGVQLISRHWNFDSADMDELFEN